MNMFVCLVKSNPVKLETSRTVIIPPTVSVLWSYPCFIIGTHTSSTHVIAVDDGIIFVHEDHLACDVEAAGLDAVVDVGRVFGPD